PVRLSPPVPAGAAGVDPRALPGGGRSRGLAPRRGPGAHGSLRHCRAWALCQPHHLASPGAPQGARRLGVSRARRGRTLVPRARPVPCTRCWSLDPMLIPPPRTFCVRLPAASLRSRRVWPLVFLLAALIPGPAAAQVGATTDIITGKVTGPDSQPLAGAVVVATSVETRVSHQRTSDAHGRFTIVFPDGGGRYELTARFISMAAVQVNVARQADEDRIVANIRMGLAAVPLEPVTVSARSGARSDRTGPGGSDRNYNPEQLARLPIDVSDVNTVATLQPGVLGIRGSDSTATAFSVAGQRPTANNITMDGMGGPIVPNKLFVFAALQGRWRGQLLPSLVSADPGTLVWLGVNPDSAARFVTLASATGAPVTVSGLSGDRATNNTLGLLRLDWQASDVHTLTLRLDGNWESQEPTRVGSLALPATGGTRTTRGGGVMASLTSFFGGRFINELRGYVARQRRDATACLTLPSGFVDVASVLPTGGETVVALAFGGNSGLPQHTNTGSLELADEFSWLPGATAHRLKVGVDVIGTRLEENHTGNQFGTFIYPSLAALAADSPAMFTRTVVPQVHPGTAWNSAVYAGDTWRVGRGGALRLTYGARLEAARFSGAPLYNRAVDSVFGVRTDRIPSEVHVSPRLGFTWAWGDGSDGPQTTFLRGGVGDFRSLTPTALYAAAL